MACEMASQGGTDHAGIRLTLDSRDGGANMSRTTWRARFHSKLTSAEEAVRPIRSGDRVFVHGAAAHPIELVEALAARADELEHVRLVQLHTEGPSPCAAPGLERSFRIEALFIGGNVREAVQSGRADYLPVF